MLQEYVKFYYDKLSTEEQNIYYQMYEGITKKQTKFLVRTAHVPSTKRLVYIYQALYHDTPSFYYLQYLDGFSYGKCIGGFVMRVTYQYNLETIARYDRQITEIIERFEKKYIQENMTEYQKELAIHDFLVRNITYNQDAVNHAKEHPDAHNIIGPLLYRTAVCQGIACAFKLMCDYFRVKCFVVVGNSMYEKTTESGHAWNMVKLDGNTYHVDVTWDLRATGNEIKCSYEYFNLNDFLIQMNHTWNDDVYPECIKLDYNYYKKYQLYVRSLQEIPEFIKTWIDKGWDTIVFKFANELPKKQELAERIQEGVSKAFPAKSVHYMYLLNPDTHTVYVLLNQ